MRLPVFEIAEVGGGQAPALQRKLVNAYDPPGKGRGEGGAVFTNAREVIAAGDRAVYAPLPASRGAPATEAAAAARESASAPASAGA